MVLICYNRKKVICTNKVGSRIGMDIVENVEMTKITFESMYNIFSWSRSGISLPENVFKLIKFYYSERR